MSHAGDESFLITVLPSDQTLYERSKRWATLIKKFSDTIDDIEDVIDSDNDFVENLKSEGNETISIDEFEDKVTSADSDFNVEAVANETLKEIAVRKNIWKSSGGIDEVMETFNLKDIEEKVGNWLRNNSSYFPSSFYKNDMSAVDEVQYGKTVVVQSSENGSIDSVDTAKYILANRKVGKTKVTTMTIKSYRRLSSKKQDRNSKCCNTDKMLRGRLFFDDNFIGLKKHSKSNTFRKRIHSENNSAQSSLSSVKRQFNGSDEKPKSNNIAQSPINKTKFKKHRRRRNRQRSPSDSSSSFSDSSNNETVRHQTSRNNNVNRSPASLHKKDPLNSANQQKGAAKTPAIVNSTALKQNDSMNKHMESFAAAAESVMAKSNTSRDSSCSSGIVIHSPSKTSSSGKFLITRQKLLDTIGEELTNSYLGDDLDYSKECGIKSRIIFIPPGPRIEMNDDSSDTESDILDSISSFTKGQIVEIVYKRP